MNTAMFLKIVTPLSLLFAVTLASAVTPNYALPPPQPVQDASTSKESSVLSNDPYSKLIAEEIQKSMAKIQYCYETELNNNKDIKGKIVILFTIGVDGIVTKSNIQESTMHDLPTEKCVEYTFSKIKFPKPTRGIVEAAYPLVFGIVPGFKNK